MTKNSTKILASSVVCHCLKLKVYPKRTQVRDSK